MNLSLTHNRPFKEGEFLRLPVRLKGDLQDRTVVAVFDWKSLKKWVLGFVITFIPTYELYVVEDYDNEKEIYVVPRMLLRTLLTVNLLLCKGHRVLAVFPQTTTFYDGRIINVNNENTLRIKFAPDEYDPIGRKRNIERHFVMMYEDLQECTINGLTKKVEVDCKRLAFKNGGSQYAIQKEMILKGCFDGSLLPEEKRNDISFLLRYGFMYMTNCSEPSPESLEYKYPAGAYVLVKQTEHGRGVLKLGIVQRNHIESLRNVQFLQSHHPRHYDSDEMLNFPQILTFKAGIKVFAKCNASSWTFYHGKVISKAWDSNHWKVKFDIGKKHYSRHVNKMFIVSREND